MLEILGKELKEEPSFDRAKAVDGREKFHCHPPSHLSSLHKDQRKLWGTVYKPGSLTLH